MTKKILIADDNPTNRELLQDILERFKPWGLEILNAENGAQALDLAKQEKPQLILLDIMMPDMSGYEVSQKIKDDPELSEVYIIMVSAKTQQEDRKQAAHAGADEYITKPFDIRLVRERVQSILDLKPI
jgi:two-component system, OmpR family, alkaline phosphatase synthesis response regulator PhoP